MTKSNSVDGASRVPAANQHARHGGGGETRETGKAAADTHHHLAGDALHREPGAPVPRTMHDLIASHPAAHPHGGLGKAVKARKVQSAKRKRGKNRSGHRRSAHHAHGSKQASGRARRAKDVQHSKAARQGTPRGRSLDGKDFKGLTAKLQQMGISKADVSAAAKQNHVPERLILGVIMQESKGNPLDRSGVGAQGLMQLMPGTAKAMGVTNANDPKQNLAGGTKYLGQMLKQFHGNESLALSAYNAGPGRVHGAVPKIRETQNYVRIITGDQHLAQAAFESW
jgi:hypothetical protein